MCVTNLKHLVICFHFVECVSACNSYFKFFFINYVMFFYKKTNFYKNPVKHVKNIQQIAHTICPVSVQNFYIMFNCIVSVIFCRIYFSLQKNMKTQQKQKMQHTKYFVQLRGLNYCKKRKMHDCTQIK